MSDKYLAVTPYRSGLGNVIMSYECALAIAHITGRKLIVPPTIFLYLIKNDIKEKEHRLWDIFERDTTTELFEIVDYWTIPEFKGKYERIQSNDSWFANLSTVVDDCRRIHFSNNNTFRNLSNGHMCFVNDHNHFDNSQDYRDFTSQREIIDLKLPEKFLHFENNLFQNYWFITYPGSGPERNILKQKINSATRYKKHYYDIFEQTKMCNVSKYNAVHVRRNDFLLQFAKSISGIDSGEKLLSQLLRVFDTDTPLYIATDEIDPSFFACVKQSYKQIYFLNDVVTTEYTKLESAILEQIICSRADTFHGITASTFSRRIHCMRGLEGRKVNANTGINSLNFRSLEYANMPWKLRHKKDWPWHMSPYLQWTME